jgi:hypothetical protein
MLTQQASSYDVVGCNFHIQEQPMNENLNVSYTDTDQSAKLTDQVISADPLATVAKSAQPTPL